MYQLFVSRTPPAPRDRGKVLAPGVLLGGEVLVGVLLEGEILAPGVLHGGEILDFWPNSV